MFNFFKKKSKIMKKLEGKVAVITGGSSGMGLATAQEFINSGAKVCLLYTSPSPRDATLSRMPSSA